MQTVIKLIGRTDQMFYQELAFTFPLLSRSSAK